MSLSKLRVFLVAGARPNFMKIEPIYRQMKHCPRAFEPIIVHTGQHYDENMSKIFFEELSLPKPDIYLGVGSGTHAEQTAEIMKRFEPQLLKHKPDLVLVVGDVNSTIACALTAVKIRIPSTKLSAYWQLYENYIESRKSDYKITTEHKLHIRSHEAPIIAHVEAGERSFDFSMPEEINRVATDVFSDLFFTTCQDSDENLVAEGIDPRKIFRVGNVMIDSLQNFLPTANGSDILNRLNKNHRPQSNNPIKEHDYTLVTLHRPGNVDNADVFEGILSALVEISTQIPVIFPMHPRTRKKFGRRLQNKILQSRLLIVEPVGYLDFLKLQSKARMVLTDSGGIQVETSYLGIPCLTVRPNTEWQITIR